MSELVLAGGRVIDETGERVADVRVVDGEIAEVGPGARRPRPARSCSTPKARSSRPAWSISRCTSAIPAAKTPRRSRPARGRAALGGCTAVVCMPNTEPPLDDAAVVQVGPRTRTAGGVRRARRRVHHQGPAGRGALADGGALRPRRARVHRRRRLRGRRARDARRVRVPRARCRARCSRNTPRIRRSCAAATCTKVRGRRGSASPAGPRRRRSSIVAPRPACSPSSPAAGTTCCTSRARAAVELVRAAKADGVRVTAECTPQHFVLTDAACAGFDPVFKMNPPLRERARRRRVRAGLADGTIDAIATDHAPHSPETKAAPFEEAPPGMLGVETALAVVLTTLVEPGVISLAARARRPLSWRPAAIAALDEHGHGGPVAPGRPANLCVIDPAAALGGRLDPPREPLHQLTLERMETHRQSSSHDPAGHADRRATARPPDDAATGAPRARRRHDVRGSTRSGTSPRRARWRARSCSTRRSSGYQEIISDPSYAGQIITFTYPHIGNYGVNARRRRSARPRCRGVIVRELVAPAVELARDRRIARLPRAPRDRRASRASTRAGSRVTSARPVRCRARSESPTARRCSRPREPTAAPTGAISSRRSPPPSRTRVGPDDASLYVVAYDFGIKRVDPRSARAGRLPGGGRPGIACRPPTCSAASPTACSSRTGPAIRRPSGHASGIETVRSAARQGAGVRHLPRPPADGARARRVHVQAALRSSRRQPPGAEPRDRAGSRSPARTTTTPSTRESLPAGSRGHAPQSERRRRRGSARRATPRVQRAVPPRSGPRDRTTRATSSPSSPSSCGRSEHAAPRRPRNDPAHRKRPDRDRAGVRVRLLGHASLPGAARRRLPRRARELEPGHDHDRSRVRRRHVRRAARRCRRSSASSRRERPTRCFPHWAARPASTSRSRSHEAGVLDAYSVEMIGAEHRSDPHRRGPPAVQAVAMTGDRPAGAAVGRRVRGRRSAHDRGRSRLPGDRAPGVHPRRRRHRHRPRSPTRCSASPSAAWPRARSRRSSSSAAIGRLEGIRARGDARPRRQRAS